MKKHIFLLSLSAMLFSCSSIKKTVPQKQKPLPVELVLENKPKNFVWKKGAFLNLKGTITNKSKKDIIILKPKSSYQIDRDYFKVSFSENFLGSSCLFEVEENETPRKLNDFITITPNESIVVYISGRNYFIKNCNSTNTTVENIKLNLTYNYYETKLNYNKESYFIQQNYKAELNEKDEQSLISKIESLKNSSRIKAMSEERQKKTIAYLKKSMRSNLIKCTPEEQSLIISNFNNLLQQKVESNSINITVEQ